MRSGKRSIGIVVCVALMGTAALALARGVDAGTPSVASQERAAARLSDGWITMKIHSQFVPEEALEDSNIDVDTVGGVVTLSGTVASEAGRARAVALAKATDGVKSVTDKLRIATEKDTSAAARDAARDAKGTAKDAGRGTRDAAKASGRRVNDGWIKSKIYSQFLTENALEDSDIDIDVTNGMVVLNGTVASDAGRARATAIAKATDGVKGVKDALKVAKRK